MKRSHYRHLPRLEVFCPEGYGRDALGELALRASYVGSVDHKVPAIPLAIRQPCPAVTLLCVTAE